MKYYIQVTSLSSHLKDIWLYLMKGSKINSKLKIWEGLVHVYLSIYQAIVHPDVGQSPAHNISILFCL